MIFHYFNAGQIIAIAPIDLSQIVSFISNSSLCCLGLCEKEWLFQQLKIGRLKDGWQKEPFSVEVINCEGYK
jgi:hypothetical protein